MKIAIINGVCKRYDAISEAVLGTMEAARSRLGAEVHLFAYSCDFPNVPFTHVDSVSDIAIDPFISESDLIIYHFGIYYRLFNMILIGNGRAKQAVRYHNITPKSLLPAKEHLAIDKSNNQIANLTAADIIWADSETNKRDLVERGIDPDGIEVAPLYVKSRFQPGSLDGKPTDRVQILYVGRFVESKGVTDLLRAVAQARTMTDIPLRLDLVGNLSFSDPGYISKVRKLIEELDLAETVEFVGEVDDEELGRRLASAHIFAIASYHEGFCVPLVEAMNARCVPVAYAAGNVPDLMNKFGDLVPAGEWRTFGDRLARLAKFFHASQPSSKRRLPLSRGARSVSTYEAELAAYLEQYTFDAFSDRVARQIERLI